MRTTSALIGVLLVLLATPVLAADRDGSCRIDGQTILIYGRDGFERSPAVVSGCGTAEAPYILEGWRIDACGADFGISIEHSTAHFIVRDCAISGASGAGIRLLNVRHGKVERCTVLGNEIGILLEDAHESLIVGNLVGENRIGVAMRLGAGSNIVTANSFAGNGQSAHDPGGRNLWSCDGIGNFWSDYQGSDADGDGLGDRAYTAPVVDRHPLIVPPSACADPTTVVCPPTGPVAIGPSPVEMQGATSPCAPECPPAIPATVFAGEDQLLTCARPEVTLTAELRPGPNACGPCAIVWTRAGKVVGESCTLAVREPGVYTVTVTAADGCRCADSVTVTEDTDRPAIVATVDGPINCVSPETSLMAQVTGGTRPVTIEWVRDGVVVGRGTTLTVDDPGRYTARAIGANGCSSLAMVDVVEDARAPRVTAMVDRSLSCTVQSTDLRAKATGGTAPYTYVWRAAGGAVLGRDPTITVDRAGTYVVDVTGANGCTGSATAIVIEDTESPVVNAVAEGILTCDVHEVRLTADISRGRPPYDISWTTPGGVTICRSATLIADEAGSYTVTVTGANGCSASDTVVVAEDTDPPLVDAGDDRLLTLETPEVTLTATIAGAPGPYDITWRDTLGDVVGRTASITVDRAGEYTVTVVRDTGCSASDEVLVTSHLVSEVVVSSDIDGLAVFGQLTMDGVPIPESVFFFEVEAPQTGSETEPATITMTTSYAEGYEANGAEVYYIIPGNETVAFGIHKEQFIAGKKYYLLHLPTDPPGQAAVAFF